jgi:hypothetical protein
MTASAQNSTYNLDVLEAALLVARPAEVAEVLKEKGYSQPEIASTLIQSSMLTALVAIAKERLEAPILASPYQTT